jgi:peptide chain release factor 1
MTTKLEAIYQRYLKLTELVGDPEVIKNIDEWRKYTKELSDMEEVIDKYKEYKKVSEEKADAESSLLTETDSEMKSLLSDEIQELKEKLNQFHDSCIVCIPNRDFIPGAKGSLPYSVAQNIAQGVNELDGIVFIDDYVEDDEDEVQGL